MDRSSQNYTSIYNTCAIWVIILLTLLALALIGWNMTGLKFNDKTELNTVDENKPTSQSQHMVMAIYDPSGKLHYKLVAESVKNYEVERLTWFTQPVMTLFDGDAVATWSVRANRAKLTHDNMLYLYGGVEIDNLTTTSPLQKIKTEEAEVNLVTQDVTSNDEITLYGNGFMSTGMKMRGNLRNKTAELLEKVKTYYEIQNKNPLSTH